MGATDIDPFVINIAQGGVPTMLSAAVLIAASSNNIAKAIYALESVREHLIRAPRRLRVAPRID